MADDIRPDEASRKNSEFAPELGAIIHPETRPLPLVIFRVQDKDGRGPWKPGFSHRWVEDRPDEEFNTLVPWPVEFGDIRKKAIVGMSLGCGCRTLDQLRRWFTSSEYSTLRKFGYCAVKMEVGRILAESKIQCVFERVKPLRDDVDPVVLYPC